MLAYTMARVGASGFGCLAQNGHGIGKGPFRFRELSFFCVGNPQVIQGCHHRGLSGP